MLEKSENYKAHKAMMKEMRVPSFSEAHHQLGDHLANVLIDECPDALRIEMGVDPKLHGAGEDLWTSPSDLLEGLVVLKPPFTNRYIKALTHDGILAIGSVIEQKYRQEMELERKRALEEQEVMLRFLAEQEQIKAIENALVEEARNCAAELARVDNDFEEHLKEELAALTEKLQEDTEKKLVLQQKILYSEWEDKLVTAIEETTRKLTMKFLDELQLQENYLTSKFHLELKKQEAKYEASLVFEQSLCKETLKQLKHNLECKNISNLVYVLCMERRKCESKRQQLEDSNQKVVDELTSSLSVAEDEIIRLKEECARQVKTIDIRERCLREIIKQFQKFIYFALKASPQQGEFLLNIDKMLLYEMTEAVMNSTIQEMTSPPSTANTGCTNKSELVPLDLTLPGDHDCLDELDPENDDDAGSELVAVVYNARTYVREDFRNMISRGIEVPPTSDLWSRDVEQLIAIMKTSVIEKRPASPPTPPVITAPPVPPAIVVPRHSDTITVEGSCVAEGSTTTKSTQERTSHHSRRSSVHFQGNRNATIIDSIPSTSTATDVDMSLFNEQQMLIECLLATPQTDEDCKEALEQAFECHRQTSALLGAKDSLTHHRMSLKATGRIDDTKIALSGPEKTHAAHAMKDVLMESDNLLHSVDAPSNQKPPVPHRVSNVGATDNVVEITPRERRFSAISMALDSLELLKVRNSEGAKDIPAGVSLLRNMLPAGSKSSGQPLPKGSSKLSLHRDSVELLRAIKEKEGSPHESILENVVKSPSCSLKETPNFSFHSIGSPPVSEAISNPQSSPAHPPESENKRNSLNYYNVKLPKSNSLHINSVVNFAPLAQVYLTESVTVGTDATWRVYHDGDEPVTLADDSGHGNFLGMEGVAAIEGASDNTEGDTKDVGKFAVDRIHALIGVLKEDSSLMRMFTSCTR